MPEPVDWTWPDGDGTSGVHMTEGRLVWWYTPGGPNGRFGEVAREQEVADFLAGGPAVPAPADVVARLRAALER